VCPQCGSAAAVHSISELAAMARSQLGQAQQGGPAGQPGYAADPQAGPLPGYAADPQAGPLPGYGADPQAGPLPGYGAAPRTGRLPSRPSGSSADFGDDPLDGIEQAVADIALGAVGRFLGRKISRRVQRTYSERVLPALAARQEATLREQIAIAERHPDLRACMTDGVIFLAGGNRVLPMPPLTDKLTLQQADALVDQLREGQGAS
jgi:hypothetical protein